MRPSFSNSIPLLLLIGSLCLWLLLSVPGLANAGPALTAADPTPVAAVVRPAETGSNVARLPLTMNVQGGAAGRSYYVDCWNGNDSRNGQSTGQAWQSLSKANTAPLAPGDQLLFLRGCTWNGMFKAAWKGNAGAPILISAYGSGDLPKIQNGGSDAVSISGSYLILEYLQVRSDPPWQDPNCQNQPVGWRAGFTFQGTASYNVLRNSKASELTVGVMLTSNSNHNQVLGNVLVNNYYMSVNTNNGGHDDSGAWGILLNGNDNEIAYNYISGNNAWCSYDFGTEGASIEIFKAQRNNIHHNQSQNDSTFSELGGDASIKASDNTFAYNVYASARPNSMFLIVRGGNESLGPTWRTRVYNNTVYLPVSGSQAVVCSSGCSSSILSLRNNVLWAETKAVFADAPFDEANNVYWNNEGNPLVQFMGFLMSPTSTKANPAFRNTGSVDLHLTTASPAVNAGCMAGVNAGYTTDIEGIPVPQGAGVDIGAYEFH